MVEESRQKKSVLLAPNATLLALASKKEKYEDPCGFLPISICNTFYKIISNFIANKPKSILPFLIFEEKTGYVEGQQILDGIVATQ